MGALVMQRRDRVARAEAASTGRVSGVGKGVALMAWRWSCMCKMRTQSVRKNAVVAFSCATTRHRDSRKQGMQRGEVKTAASERFSLSAV